MSNINVLLSLGFALAIAVGQIMFKLTAQSLNTVGGSLIEKALYSPILWITFGWYGLTSVLWIFILMRVPLSQAYPFALLGAAIVPLLAAVLFKEPISARYVAGGALILLGLFLAVGHPGSEGVAKSNTDRSDKANL